MESDTPKDSLKHRLFTIGISAMFNTGTTKDMHNTGIYRHAGLSSLWQIQPPLQDKVQIMVLCGGLSS